VTRNILLSTAIILGLQTIALGQSVVVSIGSGSATPGGTVTVPITLTSSGGAQTTGLQWTFSYSSDITGVTVVAGASTTNAGKSLSCSGNNCLAAGINSTLIADGTVATATFQIAANPSTNPISIQLTNVVATTAGGTSIPSSGASGSIVLPVAITLSSLTCTSSTINTPGSTACSVALTGSASASGFVVALSSNNANLTVPSSVTVASGQTGATFTAAGAQTGANQTGVVTASAGSVNLTSTLNLVAPAQLSSLTCTPSTLSSNASSTCTVALNKAATNAATVSLGSNNVLLAVPASVSVAAGQSSASFTAASGNVSSSQAAIVTATLNSQIQTATISLAAPAQLSSLNCAPSTVTGPGTSTCTATLTAAASGATSVALLSNNANVTVPAGVNIGSGLSSATFTASVAAVTSNQGALLTASLNGASQSFTLSATAPAPAQLSSLACAPSTLSSNASSTCTVTLNKAATGAATISLASNNVLLAVPASVSVAAGQSSASFTAASGSVSSSQSAIVTATLNSQIQTATISLAAAAQLSSLSCSPSTVTGPGTSTCTATLTAAASSVAAVALQSNNTNVTVPANVNIGSGLSSATFTASVAAVTSNQGALLTASLNGMSQSFTLSATAPAPAQLSSLACAPSTLSSNASSTCTVTLNTAASSGATIALASNNVLLTVPANVAVAAGQSTATFTAAAGTVSSSQSAIVTAALNGQTQTATLSLAAPAQLSSLSCSPATVTGPGTSTCTATLTAAASSAVSVTLASNNSNVTVPGSVNILAGQSSASFTATAAQVSAAQSATIAAGLGNSATSGVLSLALAQPKPSAAESSAIANPPDISTEGNWKGVYGADGEIIANDSNNPPAYLSVPAAGLFTGASTYTWVASSSEPRALQKAASATDRIASTFYAGTSYTINLPFTDGLLHQVALYLLDLDTYERAETITILDQASGAVLNTQSFANFHTGTWAIWNIRGPVVIQVTCTAGMNAVVSGLFFRTMSSGASPSAAPPTVSISAPFANQQISGTQVLSATAAAASLPGASIVAVQFQLDGNNLGAAVTSGSPYTFSWVSATTSNGPHSLVAVATDNFGQSTSSTAVAITVNNQLTTSAAFIRSDATTQGTWKGHYGADGEIVALDSIHLPAYAALNFLGAQLYQWAFTGDPRALQGANSATVRIASTYYGSPSFSLDLNLTDGNAHQVALYFMDWDREGRAETVTILDASTQALLDTPRQVSNFTGGQYLVWNLKGHVTIQFTLNAGANALVNGVFFDPAAP